MQIGILEPLHFSPDAVAILEKVGGVSLAPRNIAYLNAAFIRLGRQITSEVLDEMPKLQYLCTPTTGLTHIDLNEVEQRGIRLFSLKGHRRFLQGVRATPEHTLGLIIAMLRQYPSAFESSDRNECFGDEISGKTVGIIGFGRVGKLLAKYLRALDAHLCYCDLDCKSTSIEQCGHIAELIEKSDIIVLSASYEGELVLTPPLIEMLSGKYFVNIARGELVDEQALLSKLERGELRGAALDVIQNENGENNRERLRRAGAVVTPHIAGATYRSLEKTELFLARLFVKHLRERKC